MIVWPSLKTSITRDRGYFSLMQTVNLIISHSTVKFDLWGGGGGNQLQSVAKSAEDIELKKCICSNDQAVLPMQFPNEMLRTSSFSKRIF